MELLSYGKFVFSSGNKLAKGMCLARKARDEKCLSNCTVGHQFLFFEFKSGF